MSKLAKVYEIVPLGRAARRRAAKRALLVSSDVETPPTSSTEAAVVFAEFDENSAGTGSVSPLPPAPPMSALSSGDDPGPGWFFLGGVDGWVRIGRDDARNRMAEQRVLDPWSRSRDTARQ